MTASPSKTHARVLLMLLASSAAVAWPTRNASGEDAPKLYVHVETAGRFSYSGDPTQVSILFKNEGKGIWTNPGMDIEGGFQVYDKDAKKLERAKTSTVSHDSQPKILEPNAYFGKIVDLGALFPKISAIGSYRITWSAKDVPEQSVVTRIIKKYDPKMDYQGVIQTDFGKIVIEFYKDLAPGHVKNFIDLANLNFYDGLLFHRIVKGEMIFGGSPTGDEFGSPGYLVPPERNGLKVLPGSIAQVRNSQTGMEESGSIFLIAAAPQADLDNRVTVFARVVEGLETVKAISSLATVGGPPRSATRPIKDVVIRKIEIRDKKAAKG